MNLSRGNVVCLNAVVADRALARMRGLLGRTGLSDDEGLLLKPAPSVHTAFMNFPIDVIFLNSEFRVLKVVAALPRWRAASARRARIALELAAGRAAARGVEPGDVLEVVDVANAGARGPKSQTVNGSSPGQGSGCAPRVLLVAPERRFRAVAGALLSQYGCDVRVGEAAGDVAELARREVADVVVLDAGSSPAEAARKAARIESLDPRVGVVVVGDCALYGASTLPVLSKWESFGRIYEAIQDVRPYPEAAQ